MRALIVCFMALAVLAAGCTGGRGGTSCDDNSKCKSWEFCNMSSKTCAPLAGYCTSEDDCTKRDALMTCDLADTHLCVFKGGRCRTNANCENWQVCDAQQACRAAPGYCDSDSQCDPVFEFCNPNTNKCGPAPGYCKGDTDCDSWEKCDVVSKKCYLLEGRCDLDGDCENWQTCEVKTHFCLPKPGFCINDGNCDEWARCDQPNHKCVARQGFCGTDNECNSWEFCPEEEHRCVPQRDRCSSPDHCGDWQVCTGDHYCKARVGYCDTRLDCVAGDVCNQETHLCQ